MSCTNANKKTSESEAATEVAPAEEEWISLFNGEDFTGWRGYNRADMPAAWTIEDGAIKINGSGMGEAGAADGGDIIFDRKFKNFELTFEWKVSEGGNSGLFYLPPSTRYSTTSVTPMPAWARMATVSPPPSMTLFLLFRRMQSLPVNGTPEECLSTRAQLSTRRTVRTLLNITSGPMPGRKW